MRIASGLCLMLLMGCAMGPKFTQAPPAPEGKCTVYLMRSKGPGDWWPTTFFMNDVKVVSLQDKAYSWIHLDPGRYKVSAGWMVGKSLNLGGDFNIEAGGTYYIEYTNDFEPAARTEIVRLLPRKTGASQIQDYKYSEADAVQVPPAR